MIVPGSYVRARGSICVLTLGDAEQRLRFACARVSRIEGDRAVVHLLGWADGVLVEARRPYRALLVDLEPVSPPTASR